MGQIVPRKVLNGGLSSRKSRGEQKDFQDESKSIAVPQGSLFSCSGISFAGTGGGRETGKAPVLKSFPSSGKDSDHNLILCLLSGTYFKYRNI